MAAKKATTRTRVTGGVSAEQALIASFERGLAAEESTLARDDAHRRVDEEYSAALAEAEAGLAGSGIPPAGDGDK